MSKKALIYEDDLVASMILELILQDQGYEVLDKKISADDLIGDVQNHAPDFILLDVMLVGKKLGTEAASELRQTSNLPILFMTALNDKDTLDHIQSLGNVIFVGKPYDQKLISDALDKLL